MKQNHNVLLSEAHQVNEFLDARLAGAEVPEEQRLDAAAQVLALALKARSGDAANDAKEHAVPPYAQPHMGAHRDWKANAPADEAQWENRSSCSVGWQGAQDSPMWVERRITRHGVRVQDHWYWSEALVGFVGEHLLLEVPSGPAPEVLNAIGAFQPQDLRVHRMDGCEIKAARLSDLAKQHPRAAEALLRIFAANPAGGVSVYLPLWGTTSDGSGASAQARQSCS